MGRNGKRKGVKGGLGKEDARVRNEDEGGYYRNG